MHDIFLKFYVHTVHIDMLPARAGIHQSRRIHHWQKCCHV